jgi:hypothetical protein
MLACQLNARVQALLDSPARLQAMQARGSSPDLAVLAGLAG